MLPGRDLADNPASCEPADPLPGNASDGLNWRRLSETRWHTRQTAASAVPALEQADPKVSDDRIAYLEAGHGTVAGLAAPLDGGNLEPGPRFSGAGGGSGFPLVRFQMSLPSFSPDSAVHEFGPLVEDLLARGDELGVGLRGVRAEYGRAVAVLEGEPDAVLALNRCAHGIAGHEPQ